MHLENVKSEHCQLRLGEYHCQLETCREDIAKERDKWEDNAEAGDDALQKVAH